MPISGCHDLPLATFNLPSRVFRHGCRRAECPERRWGGFFHTLGSGQTRMPPQSDGTRGFCFGGFFHTLGSGRHEG